METQLQSSFTFWFQKYQKTEGNDFKSTLHPVANISTAREFWDYYQHLNRPSQLDDNSNLYLFRKGIKPIWEDKANHNGGSFAILAEKDKSNKMWEDVLLAFISAGEQASQINGIRLKIKKQVVAHIDIWVGDITGNKAKLQDIKKWVLKAAGLREDTNIEFLQFNTQA